MKVKHYQLQSWFSQNVIKWTQVVFPLNPSISFQEKLFYAESTPVLTLYVRKRD